MANDCIVYWECSNCQPLELSFTLWSHWLILFVYYECGWLFSPQLRGWIMNINCLAFYDFIGRCQLPLIIKISTSTSNKRSNGENNDYNKIIIPFNLLFQDYKSSSLPFQSFQMEIAFKFKFYCSFLPLFACNWANFDCTLFTVTLASFLLWNAFAKRSIIVLKADYFAYFLKKFTFCFYGSLLFLCFIYFLCKRWPWQRFIIIFHKKQRFFPAFCRKKGNFDVGMLI